MQPKWQVLKKKGQWLMQLSLPRSSTFITLKAGKSAYERFLSTASPAKLGWIKATTVHYTQVTIAQQYLVGEPSEPPTVQHALSWGESVEDETHVPLVPEATQQVSAASHGEPTDDSDQEPDVNNETPTAQQQQQRTPSIKLNFGKAKPTSAPSVPPTPGEDGASAGGSSRKRKRATRSDELESAPAPKIRGPQLLKLITKQGASTVKNSAITPGIKLKTKGKIPKRPTGVGYDSELEDREIDPIILEAFVLRMLPGDDCNYIRDAISNGTIGVSILQKGADIRMRVLDVNGRRGILQVRGKQYAFTIVDLPTITEGMKSWDRKNFIKSVDISQMCLVLGPCKDDEHARTYPLPPDVNPKNYQYAHGLTAPMRNVRKRRFERTARARLDDIESVERKVNSLLEADSKANHVSYEVLDYDPRAEEDEDEFSVEEYDSDDDAEGEEEDGYFPPQNGVGVVQTPEQQEQYRPEEISALEAMFEQGLEETVYADTATAGTAASLQPGSANPTSSSAPSVAGETTVTATPADADVGADDDDDDDEASDKDQEASDEIQETLAKIKEAEDKIARQKEQLKNTTNQIVKKKIAKKIQDLVSDVNMLRRHAGLVDKDEEEGEEGGGEQKRAGGESGSEEE